MYTKEVNCRCRSSFHGDMVDFVINGMKMGIIFLVVDVGRLARNGKFLH